MKRIVAFSLVAFLWLGVRVFGSPNEDLHGATIDGRMGHVRQAWRAARL